MSNRYFNTEEDDSIAPMPIVSQGDASKGAWFGDPELKASVVAKMAKHREQDQIVQGLYQEFEIEQEEDWKGCLIGCTLPRISARGFRAFEKWSYAGDHAEDGSVWHLLVEAHYGIPAELASILDDAFEGQFEQNAPEFAVKAIEAIPVGAVYNEDKIDEIQAVSRDYDWDVILDLLAAAPIARGVHV